MRSTQFTDADYVALDHVFSGGDISACSKGELERFAVMLSRPKAYEHFGASSFPQICETVRTLILVRMSEESNAQAKRESRLALIIAAVALLFGIVQATAALWQIVFPSPTQVNSSISAPANVAPSVQAPQTPAKPVPQSKQQ